MKTVWQKFRNPSAKTLAATRDGDRGFTLIELVIAMGIVAILAGTIVPMAFRELVRAKEDATQKELGAIVSGLMDFYEDIGRFPTEDEGLGALVADPGVSHWQGPYLGGGRGVLVDQVTKDEFGEPYAYDCRPRVRPASAVDVVVVSSGSDFVFTSGSVGSTWSLEDPGKDLMVLVTAGPINRKKKRDCSSELEAIAAASREYFEVNASFPNSSAKLVGSYMDAGIDGDAFNDPWNNAYVFESDDSPGSSLTLTIMSLGPNRENDGGNGDDLSITVSSVSPGRRSTLAELEIAQSALNDDPDLRLSRRWNKVRKKLDLPSSFDKDGWGKDYQLNIDERIVFSPGPDGKHQTTNDNIPAGVGR